MSHLATASRPELFVQVELHSRDGKRFIKAGLTRMSVRVEPDVAEEVDDSGGLDDGGISKGQIADGADVLLKLAGHAGAFAGVITVVRARREFVDEQLGIGGEKHFHGKETFELEGVGDRRCEVVSFRSEGAREGRGDDTPGEDLVVVVVPRGGIHLHLAAWRAGYQDGDLALELDGLLDHAGAFAERLPGSTHLGLKIGALAEADATLPTTVVASARAFAKAFAAEFRNRSPEFVERLNGAVGAEREPVAGEPELLLHAILDDGNEGSAGPDRSEGSCGFHAPGGDLLDFERHDIATASEVRGFAGIVPTGLDAAVNDEAGRTGRVRVEHQGAITHGTRSHGRHAAELPASEDADRCAGKKNPGRVSARCRHG